MRSRKQEHLGKLPQVLDHAIDPLELAQLLLGAHRAQGYDMPYPGRAGCLNARSGVFYNHASGWGQTKVARCL
jgi:hypothetical protein